MNNPIFVFFTGAFFGMTLALVLLLAVTAAGSDKKGGDDDEK